MQKKTRAFFEIIRYNARAHAVFFAALAAIGFIVYSNIFSVPFFFDDVNLNNYTSFTGWNSQRSLVVDTFVLNYKLGGHSVMGYHLANIILHIINAVLIYALLVLVQRTPYFEGKIKHSRLSPFFAAMVFVAHPISIQAVTLTIQRFTLLSTTLYLLAILLYTMWRLKEGRTATVYYILSLCVYLLSIRAKETVITLPAILFIYEFCFFKGDKHRRVIYILPYCVIASLIVVDYFKFSLFVESPDVPVQQNADVLRQNANLPSSQNFENRAQFLFTQLRVIVTYMRMLILPYGLTLIHHFTISKSFFDLKVVSSLIVIVFLAGTACYFFYKSHYDKKFMEMEPATMRLMSFWIAWFFITLLPQSSIISTQNWIILEHRVYLPAIGFTAVISALSAEIAKRQFRYITVYLPCAILIVTLCAVTYTNNSKWQSETSVWEDNARKEPLHHYVHILLGNVYLSNKRFDDAAKQYKIALKLKPDDPINHNNIGNIYLRNGDVNSAFSEFSEAIRLKPDYAEAHNNLGNVYIAKKDLEKAFAQFEKAVNIKKDYVEALNNLGNVYFKQGKPDEAFKYYEKAVKINPNSAETHSNLGAFYIQKGILNKAYEQYTLTLKLDPYNSNVKAYVDLLKQYR
ncbi:MAG: tetratricopeptide repeat protein [Nitrospirae bacterium]|nr:tetratricopeptide repeat protein [Nitrospirota bacterium]MBF0534872.1 tetratricopeptide repeat protein [Nitrospirota bacterium]MBF0616787.1 tetratricopeptide repeat protein [Nitrospirota bacterium]